MVIPLLSVIAVILAIYGIVALVQGRLAVGIGAILAAILIGPGGISLFAVAVVPATAIPGM